MVRMVQRQQAAVEVLGWYYGSSLVGMETVGADRRDM